LKQIDPLREKLKTKEDERHPDPAGLKLAYINVRSYRKAELGNNQ